MSVTQTVHMSSPGVNQLTRSFIPLRTPVSSRAESNFLYDQTKTHVTSGRNENIFQEDSCRIRLLQDRRDWKSIRIWSAPVKDEEGSKLRTIITTPSHQLCPVNAGTKVHSTRLTARSAHGLAAVPLTSQTVAHSVPVLWIESCLKAFYDIRKAKSNKS